jgi:N-acylneuraminate cytidylyltransferase
MRLAVIPARGGSKRIPRKNIKPFCGKPMIAWSIEAAQASGCFDRIIVSTDDAEIAEVSRSAGAEVPFMRPAELSNDHAGTLPVIAHAIGWISNAGTSPEQVCCIYATAPFVSAQDLQDGLELLGSGDVDYAFAATAYPFPIQRAFRLTETGGAQMADPEQFGRRSQDLEPYFHDAGQFYWGRAQAWREQRPVFSPKSCPLILPRDRVEDIDTPEDWRRAEWLFRALRER